MKLHLIMLILSLLVLVACNEAPIEKVHETIHLPAYLFDGLSEDEIISQGISNGAQDVSISNKGIVSYDYTEKALANRAANVKNELQQTIDYIIQSDEYTSIRNISYDEDFSKFIVVVSTNSFQASNDRTTIINLCKQAGEYQPYLKKETWTISAKIVDNTTVQTIEIIKINDAFEIIN